MSLFLGVGVKIKKEELIQTRAFYEYLRHWLKDRLLKMKKSRFKQASSQDRLRHQFIDGRNGRRTNSILAVGRAKYSIGKRIY